MTKSRSNSSGGGNTNSPPPKQISPAKKWIFVLNNYTQDQIDLIVPIMNCWCKVAFFSKEVGESGTPHLQGYCEFKDKVRPKSAKIGFSAVAPTTHWEKARGNMRENVVYSTKDVDLYWSIGIPKPVRIIEPRVGWQTDILEEVEREPDDRKIHWY